jgi:pimeloyl-[acyl-carrier protein] synthase
MTELFSPQFFADPYPIYARLREASTLPYDKRLGWMVTRYDDIRSLAKSGLLSRSKFEAERLVGLSAEVCLAARPVMDGFNLEMMRRDPPAHTRLRGLVNKAFTTRVIDQLRPRIQQIIDELLDAVDDAAYIDVIGDLAYPLPASVIMELLGVPLEDRPRLKEWTTDRIAFIGSIQNAPDPLALATRAAQSASAMNVYFREVIKERRVRPKGDLISLLIAVEEDDRLTEEEIIANCSLLLSAGHETTTNLIGNGLLALLRHPSQLRRLIDEPDRMQSAVEELLRFDSPVQLAPRASIAEIQLAGVSIPAGQRVTLMLGAANRDGEYFNNPNRLNVEREPNEHLSFGFDRHFCLGAHLARLEAQLAFSTLLRRYPGLALDGSPLQWVSNLAYRGLKALPVKLRKNG